MTTKHTTTCNACDALQDSEPFLTVAIYGRTPPTEALHACDENCLAIVLRAEATRIEKELGKPRAVREAEERSVARDVLFGKRAP